MVGCSRLVCRRYGQFEINQESAYQINAQSAIDGRSATASPTRRRARSPASRGAGSGCGEVLHDAASLTSLAVLLQGSLGATQVSIPPRSSKRARRRPLTILSQRADGPNVTNPSYPIVSRLPAPVPNATFCRAQVEWEETSLPTKKSEMQGGCERHRETW